MLLRAKKIKVIFQYTSQTKQIGSKSLWSELSYKKFQIHSFYEEKKNQDQKKTSFCAQNNPLNLNKMLISGLVGKKQRKRKARRSKSARRNVSLFSPFQAAKTHWVVGKFSSLPSSA